MGTSEVIGWIFAALGAGILYIPLFLVKPNEWLSGREMAKIRPSLKWARWGFPAITIGWSLLLIYMIFVFTINSVNDMSDYVGVYLGGVVMSSIAVLNGFFAVRTGVCPLPVPSRYFYVVRKDLARRIGRVQTSLGLLMIIASFFVIHLRLL